MLQVQALVELLEEKGLLTRHGVLERVKRLQAETAKKPGERRWRTTRQKAFAQDASEIALSRQFVRADPGKTLLYRSCAPWIDSGPLRLHSESSVVQPVSNGFLGSFVHRAKVPETNGRQIQFVSVSRWAFVLSASLA